MTPDDLFTKAPDSRGGFTMTFNRPLVEQLRRGPMLAYRDEDVAYQLVCLLEAEVPLIDGHGRLSNQDVSDAVRCADAVLGRLNTSQRIPFATRREYLNSPGFDRDIADICGPILRALADHERATSHAGFRGVNGDLRNVIFAATKKPELVWVDVTQGIVEITKNAEHCLMYDRPIPSTGLTVSDILAWWKNRDGIHSLPPTAQLQQLKTRLADSSPSSQPEKDLLRSYWAFAESRGFDSTPAILPQVYLHYDPVTQAQRDRNGGRVIPNQRRDFLLLAPGSRRIILEIDGKHHYSTSGEPDPRKYAEMVKEDRRLRLQGYEVYRFGGYEFQPSQAPDNMLMAFFTELLTD
ncbi:hypothetical protein HNR23_002256 [Nocardiopsis mwathae]|uniref:AbiJ-NTD3 domain-containing protein n=1 Tax=Nocardiopsis mwathae TaxID=1472723 RepID=A0A7W9YJ85_9ACTN|nr:hypothetical protein [Nocardiopsis mwathae]MBB6172196.1 hypothetical protein [Nocardiopsis mwathae]